MKDKMLGGGRDRRSISFKKRKRTNKFLNKDQYVGNTWDLGRKEKHNAMILPRSHRLTDLSVGGGI